VVRLERVNKIFHTRHFLLADEDTGRRTLYRKKTVHAVNDVDFAVKRGEIFGLLGPNGAGKTTAVKMISGLVRPNSGAVYVDDLHVERKRLKVLRKVGVVLEGTRTSIWPLTPLENLAYFGNLKDVKGPVLKQRSRELLNFIGLKDKMNVQVRRLSRGQKQKLAICIALIADPPVILLDEPTTGLDVQSSRAIKDKIIEITREHGKTALVTTHDMNVAQELCDRIGIINHGKLIACQPTDELLGLFAEKTFEFHLNRAPDLSLLRQIPGVEAAQLLDGEEEIVLAVTVARDEEDRSAALYGAIQCLHAQRILLRSITQRRQTLENVFLRLTGDTEPK